MKTYQIAALLVGVVVIIITLNFDTTKTQVAQAATDTVVTLNPVADTYLDSANPNQNYGSVTVLKVGSPTANLASRAIFRFDLSSIPTNAIVDSAKFQAFLHGASNSPMLLGVSIFKIDTNWTEASATWNNQPPATSIGKTNGVSTTAQYYAWDIQSLAQFWVANPVGNFGLELRSAIEGTGIGWRLFRSREFGANLPQLVIQYHLPPTPTFTPTPSDMPTATSTPTSTAIACFDTEATQPDRVGISVTIESAKGSASIDGDNPLFDNEADLYPLVSINGSPWESGPRFDGDDTPHFQWQISEEVPKNIGSVLVQIRLRDDDDPDPNNDIDLDPGADDEILDLNFDLCAYAFTDDGAGQDCDAGICRGGVNHWLGTGDRDEHASVFVRIETRDGRPVSDLVGDVAVTGVDYVQIVNQPNVAVAGRGSILQVRMANTYPYTVETIARGYIGDAVGPELVDEHPVVLAACQVSTENFFVDNPVVVDISRVHYGTVIDPQNLLTPTGAPQCVAFNNGNVAMGALPIQITRDLTIVYQRIFHIDDLDFTQDLLSDDAAQTEANAADIRMRGFYPTANFRSLVDPIPLPLVVHDIPLGPRTEIQVASELAALLGLDRVVGLVPSGWLDRHGYPFLPAGTGGVSNGKIGPHFVYAESQPATNGFIPVHELGHTFGLSDESCSIGDINVFQLWMCEDEYTGVFPNRPAGGFPATGFDIPRGIPAAGSCFMDSNPTAWISNNDFESFVRKLTPGRDPRILVVSGFVTPAGGGDLSSAIGRPEGVPDRDSRGQSPFGLRVLDSNGTILGDYGIFADMQGEDRNHNHILELNELAGDIDGNGIPDAFPISHAAPLDENHNNIPDAAERAEFALRIPWPVGGTSVALVGPHGEVIDTLAVNTQALVIDLIEPVGPAHLKPGDLLPVRWRFAGQTEASDQQVGEGQTAAMGVAIAASYDGGATWMPRAYQVQGNAFVIDARGLTQPITAQIEVLSLQNGMAGSTITAGDDDSDLCPNPLDPNPSTPDTTDDDVDGIPNICDLCPTMKDPLQTDADQDGNGDVCDADYNNDGRVDNIDFNQFFKPCVGADVVNNPACFDRDRDHSSIVTFDDFCVPAPAGMCNDGDPTTGTETCSPTSGCQPAVSPSLHVWLPLIKR